MNVRVYYKSQLIPNKDAGNLGSIEGNTKASDIISKVLNYIIDQNKNNKDQKIDISSIKSNLFLFYIDKDENRVKRIKNNEKLENYKDKMKYMAVYCLPVPLEILYSINQQYLPEKLPSDQASAADYPPLFILEAKISKNVNKLLVDNSCPYFTLYTRKGENLSRNYLKSIIHYKDIQKSDGDEFYYSMSPFQILFVLGIPQRLRLKLVDYIGKKGKDIGYIDFDLHELLLPLFNSIKNAKQQSPQEQQNKNQQSAQEQPNKNQQNAKEQPNKNQKNAKEQPKEKQERSLFSDKKVIEINTEKEHPRPYIE